MTHVTLPVKSGMLSAVHSGLGGKICVKKLPIGNRSSVLRNVVGAEHLGNLPVFIGWLSGRSNVDCVIRPFWQ